MANNRANNKTRYGALTAIQALPAAMGSPNRETRLILAQISGNPKYLIERSKVLD
jgi:hypothetical protein